MRLRSEAGKQGKRVQGAELTARRIAEQTPGAVVSSLKGWDGVAGGHFAEKGARLAAGQLGREERNQRANSQHKLGRHGSQHCDLEGGRGGMRVGSQQHKQGLIHIHCKPRGE